nr:long-chain fatty acid--CoA ligase [Actinomycetota bacterium]
NCPEWHFADLACMSMGGVTVPVYSTNSPEQVAHIVGHSDSKVIVCQNPEQLAKVLEVRAELPSLEKAVVVDGNTPSDDFVMSWSELLDAGDAATPEAPRPNDLATLIYTSGTTGPPKGVMLTHANLWWTCGATEDLLAARMTGARTISYLPLSHIAERMLSHLLQIYYGSQTWFAQSIDTLADDMKICEPTYFFGVPRVWEKFHSRIEQRLSEAGPTDRKTKLVRRAMEVGRRVVEAEQDAVERGGLLADAKIPRRTKVQHVILDRLVLHKIRAAMGLGSCHTVLSASAPLQPELVWYFHSLGLKIAEGYGQSEDNGPTSWNHPDASKIGTVGKPLSGVTVRIADDGEILVRGGNVTSGYLNDEDSTRLLLDGDGWMHSGDIGHIDDSGHLSVTDRKKDLIITAGGKNIAPQEIEGMIQISPLISQVLVTGDRMPYLTALITLDPDRASTWAQERGIDADVGAIAEHELTLKEIELCIAETNDKLSRAEGVKRFRVLDRDFQLALDEVTPTMKVKRRRINALYRDVIEDMYRDGAPEAAAARAPKPG